MIIKRDRWIKMSGVVLGTLLVVFSLSFIDSSKALSQSSLIDNYSFEDDLEFWETNDSSAITTPEDDWLPENGGEKRLDYWDDEPYTADTFQTVSDLDSGTYTLSVWVASTGDFEEAYVYVRDENGEKEKLDIPDTDGDWSQVEFDVDVEGGSLTVGIYAEGQAEAWLGIDLVVLQERGSEPPADGEEFISGVDISTLSKVEDYGGTFYDDGVEQDVLDILTDYGVNYGRLKLWEDPVDVYENGVAYNDLDDTIDKAVRIKDAGMKFLLNFHYSGFWADPGRQDKPESWEDLPFDELVQAVYDHTADSIEALTEAGAEPDMVQIGNEIRPGMLFPDGRIDNNDFSNLAELLNSGIQAVRDTLGEDVDIMLHLDQGGDNDAFQWWFDGIIDEGVTDFQIIGASYYPYWHGTLDELEYNLNDISDRYDRDVIVVETAYAFTLDDMDGHPNIFTETEENTSGYPATVEGQARFLYDVMEVVRNVPNDRGTGIFYWEPAWLGVDGAGWRAGEGNAWENQAMFDFEGNALDSLNVFTPGHVPPEPEPREEDEEDEDPTLADLLLHSLNKPAEASSSEGHGGGADNAPENAVDENEGTSWGTDEGAGAWWQVDLEEEKWIERILIHFWDGVSEYKVEVSDDGESFSEIGTYDVETAQTDITLPEETTARYVRVTITEASSDWVGFMSFNAYGPEGPPEADEEDDPDPGKGDDKDKPSVVTAKIGEETDVYAGSVVEIEGTKASVTMPDDLPDGTKLTVHHVAADNSADYNLQVAGDVLEFLLTYPDGHESYSGAFSLSLGYDTDKFDADDVDIYYYDEEKDTWVPLGATAEDGLLTVEVDQFSMYGVFAEITDETEENGPVSDDGNGDPAEAEADTGVSAETGEDASRVEQREGTGETLPDTATSNYSAVLAGVILLAGGLAMFFIRKRKKITNQ